LTIEDGGRELVIKLYNQASADARLDVYMANSLGHHLPGRIFSGALPTGDEGELKSVSPMLLFKMLTFW